MGVADLVQTLELGRKSGVLHLKARTGARASCHFRQGRVVDCELGELQGEEAFYRILRWHEGGFAIEFKPIEREERIQLPTQALLLQGMRRMDEWGRVIELLPPLDRRLEVDVARLGERLSKIPDGANALVRLFDGRRTLAQVLEAAPGDDLAAADTIARLLGDGILTEQGATGPAPPARRLWRRPPRTSSERTHQAPRRSRSRASPRRSRAGSTGSRGRSGRSSPSFLPPRGRSPRVKRARRARSLGGKRRLARAAAPHAASRRGRPSRPGAPHRAAAALQAGLRSRCRLPDCSRRPPRSPRRWPATGWRRGRLRRRRPSRPSRRAPHRRGPAPWRSPPHRSRSGSSPRIAGARADGARRGGAARGEAGRAAGRQVDPGAARARRAAAPPRGAARGARGHRPRRGAPPCPTWRSACS